MEYVSKKYDGFIFDFAKSNVILGANGTGKSSLLAEIRDDFKLKKNVVFVEGGRSLQVKAVIKPTRLQLEKYDRLQDAIFLYEKKRAISLATRVNEALIVMEKKDQEQKTQHSDAVNEWQQSGGHTPCPKREYPLLDTLIDMFAEIFPKLQVGYNPTSKSFSVEKNGIEYTPASFSDGEKQVFCILADLIDLDEKHSLIIVDEPELNLHPELAERVWTVLENRYPDKVFIYATHSIGFALRDNVNNVYVISDDSEKIVLVESVEEIERSDLEAFLGGLPGILSANKVVVTEGHEKSFDAIFYRWLLGDRDIEIYPNGGCNDVIDVVGKSGLWEKISTKIKLIGVIDQDYRNDDCLVNLSSLDILQLPFHEAESYLCLPEIVSSVGKRIGSQENVITEGDVKDFILNEFERLRIVIAAKRIFVKAKFTMRISIAKSILSNITTEEQLIIHMKRSAVHELEKAQLVCSNDEIDTLIKDELNAIDRVIADKDILLALKYMPAKELLNKLAPRAGCRSGLDLMRSLSRNYSPKDFNETEILQLKLHRLLNK